MPESVRAPEAEYTVSKRDECHEHSRRSFAVAAVGRAIERRNRTAAEVEAVIDSLRTVAEVRRTGSVDLGTASSTVLGVEVVVASSLPAALRTAAVAAADIQAAALRDMGARRHWKQSSC